MKEPKPNFIKCCYAIKENVTACWACFVMIGDEICRLRACSFELLGAGSSYGKEMLHCILHKRFVFCLVVESIFTGFLARSILQP